MTTRAPSDPLAPLPAEPDCTIRAATRADAGTIGSLVHRLLAGIMPPDQLLPVETLSEAAGRLFDEGPGFAAYLAEEADGTPAGLITLTELGAVFARGRFGEVAELYVEPAWRSRQLGARLIARAAEHGRAAGWTRLELTAPHADDAPDASRAWAFYRRLGFVEAGPRMKVKL
ncbi:N-acetylglutamate synthase, GNAT family [Tistlia consotensis]|uniref:N-acetylglutamate synthase, GNAT family n=1 Tax=Tistlia consotensis USBA 355 TaxID=560819 RepID=A0A1Y6B3U5_9PROT|nr:GNAT family N-acetyltransferase [Tistlia consotensis]SME88617.1 N-acetylglutamate synthase, GNAT family [Tistlia consotensis USBA 355]SNR25145.1 N-acetylglutamate synthase, GNAT family [Tistlia consotensis]